MYRFNFYVAQMSNVRKIQEMYDFIQANFPKWIFKNGEKRHNEELIDILYDMRFDGSDKEKKVAEKMIKERAEVLAINYL